MLLYRTYIGLRYTCARLPAALLTHVNTPYITRPLKRRTNALEIINSKTALIQFRPPPITYLLTYLLNARKRQQMSYLAILNTEKRPWVCISDARSEPVPKCTHYFPGPRSNLQHNLSVCFWDILCSVHRQTTRITIAPNFTGGGNNRPIGIINTAPQSA